MSRVPMYGRDIHSGGMPCQTIFATPCCFVTSKIALGRVGRVEDVMGAVVYLASDASALVTGSALMIDGGWTAA